MADEGIRIHLTAGKPFVWKADDVAALREEHRIVGTLVGCLPRNPRQNVHLGLPLQLMPEEANVLLKKGICKLVDGNIPPRLPTEEEVQKFKDHRHKRYQEQISWSRKEKKAELQSMRQTIFQGKKAKLESEGGINDEETLEKEVELILDRRIPDLPEKHSVIQIHTVTPDYKPYEESPATWEYPKSDLEKLSSRVFEDLWNKGYFLTSGGKFGGNFLVYPGDPAMFHSFYIAVIVGRNERLISQEIAGMSRLGTSVKKTVLICSEDNHGELTYISLQWAGIT